MEGVTILQVIENIYLPDWAMIIQIIAIFIGVITFLCSFISLCFKDYKTAIILFGIAIVCGLLILFTSYVPKETDITYRVLVDSNVDMNEFFSKYELIRTEGLIDVVREIGAM